MAFVVVLDACVLHPPSVRDLLIRLALTGLYRARWSSEILDECFRSIVQRRPDLEGKLARTRALMEASIPDVLVSGHETLVDGLELPDSDDRHVLAAAIRSGAQVIVTTNLGDFPSSVLDAYDIEAQHPDTFVMHLLSLDPGAVLRAVTAQSTSLRNPPMMLGELLDTLESRGLVQTVTELRKLA